MKKLVLASMVILLMMVSFVVPVSAKATERPVMTGYRLPFASGLRYYITNVGATHGYGRHAIDFSMNVGTQVSSMAYGTVRRVSVFSDGGKFIAVDHGSYCSFYIHLSEFRTYVGNYVTRGEIIALSGNTGNSTGPHLHVALMPDSNNTCPYNAQSEYPIGFYEYGNKEIVQRYVYSKYSLNYLYKPPFSTSATARATISSPEVNLTVCDPYTLYHKYVYATLYRGPAAGYPEKQWSYVKFASSTCVTFTNMDGSGNTYAGTNYYFVTSLSPISSAEARARRTSCFYETSRTQMCGYVRR